VEHATDQPGSSSQTDLADQEQPTEPDQPSEPTNQADPNNQIEQPAKKIALLYLNEKGKLPSQRKLAEMANISRYRAIQVLKAVSQ
ncbi:hypothetical protein, partial [Hazenella coriacea]